MEPKRQGIIQVEERGEEKTMAFAVVVVEQQFRLTLNRNRLRAAGRALR